MTKYSLSPSLAVLNLMQKGRHWVLVVSALPCMIFEAAANNLSRGTTPGQCGKFNNHEHIPMFYPFILVYRL